MDKNIIAKLKEILKYYKDTYEVKENLDEILAELLDNNVEIYNNSFYCPIWRKEVGGYVLLAGTKDRADAWVLKKIIKLIKSGDKVYTMFNGNSDYLIKIFSRYNIKVMSHKDDIAFISFNT